MVDRLLPTEESVNGMMREVLVFQAVGRRAPRNGAGRRFFSPQT